jgi:8-oxoguanine DNA glycosylase, N-terminal domain
VFVRADDLWIGVVKNSVICIKQMPETTLYKWIGGSHEEATQLHSTLHGYFQLETVSTRAQRNMPFAHCRILLQQS